MSDTSYMTTAAWNVRMEADNIQAADPNAPKPGSKEYRQYRLGLLSEVAKALEGKLHHGSAGAVAMPNRSPRIGTTA